MRLVTCGTCDSQRRAPGSGEGLRLHRADPVGAEPGAASRALAPVCVCPWGQINVTDPRSSSPAPPCATSPSTKDFICLKGQKGHPRGCGQHGTSHSEPKHPPCPCPAPPVSPVGGPGRTVAVLALGFLGSRLGRCSTGRTVLFLPSAGSGRTWRARDGGGRGAGIRHPLPLGLECQLGAWPVPIPGHIAVLKHG